METAVNFILSQRKNNKKMIIIGQSQGTLISASAFALKPEFYQKRISLFIAINPTIEF